jgi:hypothetical protein
MLEIKLITPDEQDRANQFFTLDEMESGTVYCSDYHLLSDEVKQKAIVYKISDLAYWDAIVLWSDEKQKALAVYSQVISLRQSTVLTKKLLLKK